MGASEKQHWITRALASLASAEWHDYSAEEIMPIWREVVDLAWAHGCPQERKFLEIYGELLQQGAIPCYPLVAQAFTMSERKWLMKLFQLEPCVKNAVYYARCAANRSNVHVIKYELEESDDGDFV